MIRHLALGQNIILWNDTTEEDIAMLINLFCNIFDKYNELFPLNNTNPIPFALNDDYQLVIFRQRGDILLSVTNSEADPFVCNHVLSGDLLFQFYDQLNAQFSNTLERFQRLLRTRQIEELLHPDLVASVYHYLITPPVGYDDFVEHAIFNQDNVLYGKMLQEVGIKITSENARPELKQAIERFEEIYERD